MCGGGGGGRARAGGTPAPSGGAASQQDFEPSAGRPCRGRAGRGGARGRPQGKESHSARRGPYSTFPGYFGHEQELKDREGRPWGPACTLGRLTRAHGSRAGGGACARGSPRGAPSLGRFRLTLPAKMPLRRASESGIGKRSGRRCLRGAQPVSPVRGGRLLASEVERRGPALAHRLSGWGPQQLKCPVRDALHRRAQIASSPIHVA
ncbi:translation initiation factor IF-2-like [Vulpes lagopus]|uniref:translation initiation factor IF-2-like n=1 Tax=Vulpes lagopus TaxID=494514 RepID=UPI001BC8F4EE|nr:translation initiation factor IF-2-like [Vulpes lagopus]